MVTPEEQLQQQQRELEVLRAQVQELAQAGCTGSDSSSTGCTGCFSITSPWPYSDSDNDTNEQSE